MKLRDYLKEETLSISNDKEELGTRNLKFTKRNIEKIAMEWDAEIQKIETGIKHAMLKDHLGRILFVDVKTSRRRR